MLEEASIHFVNELYVYDVLLYIIYRRRLAATHRRPLCFRNWHLWTELYEKNISAKEKQYEKHVRNSYQKWSENHEK